jgi:hypothetical protein
LREDARVRRRRGLRRQVAGRFHPSALIDAQVSQLLLAMLEPINPANASPLVVQAQGVSVVGRSDADCLLEVRTDAPLVPSARRDGPIAVALVDPQSDEAEDVDEPYVGALELYVRRGRMWALIVSSWYPMHELPEPSRVHPSSTASTGHTVISRGRFKRGYVKTSTPIYLSR